MMIMRRNISRIFLSSKEILFENAGIAPSPLGGKYAFVQNLGIYSGNGVIAQRLLIRIF